MKHKHSGKCRGWCYKCCWITVGFLIEHAFWELTPGIRLIPPLLGIH